MTSKIEDIINIEKMSLESLDLKNKRLNELKKLFPEIFSDGKLNALALSQLIGETSTDLIEKFGLSWSGKFECMRVIQKPSVGTLLPLKDQSINFNDALNVIIEGDNLEVLKLLQKSYYGKIKMIYIDPPYNTGKEFIYPDNFQEGLSDYLKRTNQVDGSGFKLNTNTETSGRFHTNWLNMIYPRIFLAKNLLKEDGFLFISISDIEQAKLRLLCDEIFGEENFIANLIWMKGKEGGNDNLGFGVHHDYILCYAKSSEAACKTIKLDKKDESRHITSLPEENRVIAGAEIYRDGQQFQLINLSKQKDYRVKIPLIDGTTIEYDSYAPQKTINEYIRIGKVFVGKTGVPYIKSFIADEKEGGKPSTLIESKYGTTKAGGIAIRELFGDGKIFSYPKPPDLIRRLVEISTSNSEEDAPIILDFFAGSGTTGQAVIEQNFIDSKKRKFILVQLPETIEENTSAAVYCDFIKRPKTIVELTRERFRILKKKNKEIFSNDLYDFKAYKLEKSNFEIWDSRIKTPQDLVDNLRLFKNNIIDGRTSEDIVVELLLKSGFQLTENIKKLNILEKEVFSIAQNFLLICLDRNLNIEVIEKMMELNPSQIICLDEGFQSNDQLKVNVIQTIKSRQENKETKTIFRVV